MASTQQRDRKWDRGAHGKGQGVGFNVNEEGFNKNLSKTFFDEKSLNMYSDLENKNVIRLKYCVFDEFDGVLEDIHIMLSVVCEVNDITYVDLVKQFLVIWGW